MASEEGEQQVGSKTHFRGVSKRLHDVQVALMQALRQHNPLYIYTAARVMLSVCVV